MDYVRPKIVDESLQIAPACQGNRAVIPERVIDGSRADYVHALIQVLASVAQDRGQIIAAGHLVRRDSVDRTTGQQAVDRSKIQ